MNKQILPAFLFLLGCFPAALFSQALDLGCDGTRYRQDIFSGVTKTTVDYAPTISHTGLAIVLKMDVYQPEGDAVAARPAVILAHGGSFIFGDKSMMQSYCELLARKGYVAASIQYRIYPVFVLGYPDSIDIFDSAVKAVGDMKAAVRYFREDAATVNQFHVDPDNIYIGGYSAGAVTALHAAYLEGSDDIPAFMQTILNANGGFEGISGSASNHTYSSWGKAVANMSGGLYRSEWINAPAVPLVSIHGTADETVPYFSGIAAGIAYLEGSGLLHPQAEAAGIWNYLETVPGGGHSDIYDQPQFAASLNNFIVEATDLLESLTCASTDAQEVFPADEPDYWTLGPNPSTGDAVQVYLPGGVGVADVRVFDLSGKLVLQKNGVADASAIQTGGMPSGVFSVQITDPANPAREFPLRQLLKQ